MTSVSVCLPRHYFLWTRLNWSYIEWGYLSDILYEYLAIPPPNYFLSEKGVFSFKEPEQHRPLHIFYHSLDNQVKFSIVQSHISHIFPIKLFWYFVIY
jgi:hypothetical protein